MGVVEDLVEGSEKAAARIITFVENYPEKARDVLIRIYGLTGKAHVVGFTGSPGVGKSSLVDRVTREYRKRRMSVGIIAVDPSSPFTGGAVLGDRVRMIEVSLDPEVFMRSMGTRGQLGGLSAATLDAISVLDAMGKDRVLVETVGAGQAEVDIVGHAHTRVVVEAPGLGDDVQAIKAGIMEIADVFAVNKADRDGAQRRRAEIESMLTLGDPEPESWRPKVMETVSTSHGPKKDEGIVELVDEIESHREWLGAGEGLRWERELARRRIRRIIESSLSQQVDSMLDEKADVIDAIARREKDPYTLAEEILDQL